MSGELLQSALLEEAERVGSSTPTFYELSREELKTAHFARMASRTLRVSFSRFAKYEQKALRFSKSRTTRKWMTRNSRMRNKIS